jgi:cobalt-zinc-cadmium efflux system membrane fusion protein
MKALSLKSHVLAIVLWTTTAGPGWAQPTTADNPLQLDAQALQQSDIRIDQAALRTLTDELKAPGEVKADAYATVLVTPRVETIVVARQAKLGEVVSIGQPLVVLSSVQVAETQGALIVAEQDWQRVAALGPQAVSARRYNEAKVMRDQSRAKLRAFGLSDGQISAFLRRGSAAADGSYALLAPAVGRITTDDFLVGERVEAGRALFTLVREDSIWVEAQMSPADAEKAKPDGAVRILAHDVWLPGTVVQRAHQSNERTRTVPVRIAVDNSKDLLHPGELVEARVATGLAAPTLAVPAEAIVLMQNQPMVFLAKGNGLFEPAAVVTGSTQEGWTEIRQGLKAGDNYVRQGAFVLKARLLRSQLGED